MADMMSGHPVEEPRVPEIDRSSDPEDIRTTITRANPQSRSDPSDLRYRHPQAAILAPLV